MLLCTIFYNNCTSLWNANIQHFGKKYWTGIQEGRERTIGWFQYFRLIFIFFQHKEEAMIYAHFIIPLGLNDVMHTHFAVFYKYYWDLINQNIQCQYSIESLLLQYKTDLCIVTKLSYCPTILEKKRYNKYRKPW